MKSMLKKIKEFLKKKGFTLIELLAVIVILAIIALIATPLILNMIEDSRIKSAEISGENYIKAVNYKIAQELVKGNTVSNGEYVIGENELAVEVKNASNITGSYEIGSTGVLTAGLCINNYSIEYSSGQAYYKRDINYCGDAYVFEEPEAELLSNVCENNDLYTEKSKFKVYTVEDLVCLSNLVNGGKNFSGKEIYVLKDIDFNNTTSYKTPEGTTYGDINGNGTLEGLKVEVTTGGGFKPIGTDGKPFSGTFLGYAYTISNLMINRTIDYVGLFGYNAGTIKGIILANANVTGRNIVGGLVGYTNKGIIRDNIVKGSVTGNNSVGGILGTAVSTSGNSPVDNVVFSGNVTGNDNLGGLMGYDSHVDLSGLVYDSTIKTTSTGKVNIGKITGGINSTTSPVGRVSNVTLQFSQRNSYGSDGSNYSASEKGMLVYDDVLDTIIGGDNDEDEYYFDYDSERNAVLYSTERNPIQNKLKGDGSSDKPYLIRNANDWRLATALATQSKYFSVVNDIDFTDRNYYPLGTTTNKFNGNINGNMNTISNVFIGGYSNVGLVGYNTGTIRGFKFDNITVSSSGEHTGLIGYNDHGTVKGIVATNINITGTNSTGGLVGYTNKGTIQTSLVKGNITGNNNVGGILGGAVSTSGNSPVNNIVFSGNVTGNDNLGGLMGYDSHVDLSGLVYDSTIKTTSTGKIGIGKITGNINSTTSPIGRVSNVTLQFSQRNPYGSDGSNYRASESGMLVYDDVLDTIIGGDNDEDEYYFDYDSNNNLVVLSTDLAPIENKLSGAGTQASPYLIKNATDWKMASALVTQNKYFSVTSDIDFTGKNYYPLGTTTNAFNGNINGNMHTISNVTVGGFTNVGLFGYNTGTIEGLKFNNISISASDNNAGVIGYNDHGTIRGIVVTNITVSGKNLVGGLVGYINKGMIRGALVSGNITGNNTVGGILGGAAGTSGSCPVDSLVFTGNVTGNDSVGGLMGSDSHVELKGFVYNSLIKSTNTGKIGIGKITGNINSVTSPVGKVYNVTLQFAQRTGYGSDGTNISELSISNVASVIDTTDSDSDYYYFTMVDNNLELVKAN